MWSGRLRERLSEATLFEWSTVTLPAVILAAAPASSMRDVGDLPRGAAAIAAILLGAIALVVSWRPDPRRRKGTPALVTLRFAVGHPRQAAARFDDLLREVASEIDAFDLGTILTTLGAAALVPVSLLFPTPWFPLATLICGLYVAAKAQTIQQRMENRRIPPPHPPAPDAG